MIILTDILFVLRRLWIRFVHFSALVSFILPCIAESPMDRKINQAMFPTVLNHGKILSLS